jgi:hypothetical protein
MKVKVYWLGRWDDLNNLITAVTHCPKCRSIITPIIDMDASRIEVILQHTDLPLPFSCPNNPRKHNLLFSSIIFGLPEEKEELINNIKKRYGVDTI